MTMASTRPYFKPAKVPDEVSRSARGCVKACTAFLGRTALEEAVWNDVLRDISPEGCVIRGLNNLDDIMPHLDNLYVATMNKNGGIVGHSAVLYRSKDQMGTKKCHLYNPGGSGRSTSSILDLSRERDTAGWNYICAVFIPGTDIPTKTPEVVDMQSDDDQDDGLSLRGSDGAAASSQTSSSSSTPASRSQTASAQRNEVNEYSPTRRQPSRATKSRYNNSLFYKERLVPTAREDYRRVEYCDYSSDKFPDQCTKEMIGQHVARYLLNTKKWVVWFRLSTSEYVIAKKDAFRDYSIEEAELGKCRFIGYASLAEWAFREEIYEKSIQDADGKVFLEAVGLSVYKLSSSTSSGKKRRTIGISDDGAQKKKKKQYAASGDQLA